MDKGTALNSAREYAAIVRRMMDTRQVLLYGSHVKGTATDESDIDIAVIVDEAPHDYFSALTSLWQAAYAVSTHIEPVLLFTNDERGGFLQEVLRTGVAV